MKIKEYLEYVDKATVDDNGNVVFPKEVYEFNKELIEKYPWLKHNALYNENEDKEYDYSKTWLDEIPRGWAIAFGEDIIREINDELVKFNFVDEYKIVQIKEKFGELRWYDDGSPRGRLSENYKVVEKKFGDDTPFYKWIDSLGIDYDKQYIVLDHNENYENPFDENHKFKENHKEINKRNFENAIEVYHVYDIIEKCRITDIIDKYEELSAHTCINCGKPAVYMSKGWICPYCEDCIAPTGNYDRIEDVLL